MIQNGPLYEPYCTSMQMFHVLLWCHDSSAYRSFLVRVGRSRATSLSKACSVMRYFLRKVPSRTERFACSLQSSCGRLIAGALTRGRSLRTTDTPTIIIAAIDRHSTCSNSGCRNSCDEFLPVCLLQLGCLSHLLYRCSEALVCRDWIQQLLLIALGQVMRLLRVPF